MERYDDESMREWDVRMMVRQDVLRVIRVVLFDTLLCDV
jgi:hypothetical protein